MHNKVKIILRETLVIASALVTLTLLSLLLAFGPQYSEKIFLGYFNNPLIFLLNFLPVAAVFLLVYCLSGRAWIAFLADSILVLGFTFSNYFLLMYRDDVLMVADVLNIREAMKMSEAGYDYTPSLKMILAAVICAALTVLIYFLCKAKVNISTRTYILTLVILSAFCLKNTYLGDYLYNNKTDNLKYVVRWSPTQLYVSKGFVYPFVHSARDLIVTLPDNYDERKIEQKLASYEYHSIPEDKRVDIIGIMLEANSDLTALGLSGIDESVYAAYNYLKENGYSGTLVNNIFAGGTIDSERAYLTGMQELTACRNNINSYVRYFGENGYEAKGGHPSEGWFYNRKNVNKYLGFSEYNFLENHYEEKYGDEMRFDWHAIDDFYEGYLEHVNSSNNNYFGFNVTYQGHAPYETQNRAWGTDEMPLYVNDAISEEAENIINNYLGSVKVTGENLKYLYERIRYMQEPCVLVLFGDHKPWLGDGNSVYKELGINIDLDTKDGYMNYYSTEYIIVANENAKKLLNRDLIGKGPTISTNYLMNEVFDLLGYEGNEFMKYTNELKEAIPVYNHTAVIDSEGNYQSVEELSKQNQKVYDEIRSLHYYYRTNFLYR